MSDGRQEHWDKVYRDKSETELSWYQASPEPSLAALARHGAGPTDSLIDIGGGISTLVDELLLAGWRDLTVLDIAPSAIAAARQRLGTQAERIEWINADIARWKPGRHYTVWHDRAVFHFLTEQPQREAYRAALDKALASGALAIIGTFAPDGPEKCSGLPVRRYDAEELQRELGPSLELIEGWQESHATPWGSFQAFNWCAFRKA